MYINFRVYIPFKVTEKNRASLVVQHLRLWASTTGGVGFISGRSLSHQSYLHGRQHLPCFPWGLTCNGMQFEFHETLLVLFKNFLVGPVETLALKISRHKKLYFIEFPRNFPCMTHWATGRLSVSSSDSLFHLGVSFIRNHMETF